MFTVSLGRGVRRSSRSLLPDKSSPMGDSEHHANDSHDVSLASLYCANDSDVSAKSSVTAREQGDLDRVSKRPCGAPLHG